MDTKKEAKDDLRILRIARAVYPESIGGGAIHVDSISKIQAEMGHEVTLLTTDRGNRSLPRTEKRNGYTIQRDRELATILGNSVTPGLLQTLHQYEDHHDIIHTHSHLSSLSNIAALCARINDIPMVITNHGLWSQTAPDWIQRIYMPTIGRFTFNSANLVLCYSDIEAKEVRQQGVQTPISVIHNGVDCSKFAPRNVKRGRELLFVGRLRESKGPSLLIDLFKRIAQDFPDLQLKIVGEGPLHEKLVKKRAQYGLEERIMFINSVENDAMPKLYNKCTCFVLPTQREGVPRTILEAMACETPVVTTNLPQIKPVLDGGGITVEPTLNAFETAIRKLLQNPEQRNEMGQIGRERVLNNYSWRDTVQKTTNRYYNLI